MEVIVAQNSGLCYGVKRALRIAKETRNQRSGRVFTLGDLIHNPQVINDLKKQGIASECDLTNIKEGTVIIRSHGISPEVYTATRKHNLEIIDATCPIVKKIQKLVENLARKENEIIIVGNKEHPEIKGLIGYSQEKGVIIENESQAKDLSQKKKRAVLAQSTQDIYLFKRVITVLIEKTRELSIHNTICQSTQIRQKSTSELASLVDILFIIGGRNSSNTYKLYQISKKILSNTYFIETAKQIAPDILKGAKTVGLSGGASTPPEAIQEAANKIRSLTKNQIHRENLAQCQS